MMRIVAKQRTPVALFAVMFIGLLLAGTAAADDKSSDGKTANLPLNRVVMFNAGVGFFEHRGEVDGDSTVDFKFRVDDVNDLLKSMVLEDLGGGRISTVTYESKDPVTKTLQTFTINLTDNPTLGQILNQARGERVEVNAPNAISGVIVGVETRRRETDKDHPPIEIEMLNLLTEQGLRSIPLDSVGHVKFVDEKLDRDLRQALQTLAKGHATDKKTVSLHFQGSGKRPVRVGYIQETPVWKTSYRLVLKDGAQPFLQGWAIVENTTEEDWKNVNLTLVSGRPVSFVMDLYEPLYVKRPTVEPELFASLRPQKYEQDVLGVPRPKEEMPHSPAKGAGGFGIAANAPAAPMASAVRSLIAENEELDLKRGVASAAQTSDVGELFQYAIDAPVTLPRQQSAMLPIVNESVKGEKVSIYNQSVQAKHPLNGLELVNSTDLHLMQGPITVFDGGTYAGDAQIQDLAPGGERLLSYAVDLDTEVVPTSHARPQQLVSVRIAKGVLYSEYKLERSQEYVIKNSGKKAKRVLVEYPLDPDWKLLQPEKPTEKTRGMYRFAVQAEPGKSADLTVKEERVINQQVALTNLDSHAIVVYLNAKTVSDRVKQALQEVVKRQRSIREAVDKRLQLEQQVTAIDQEQQRIRGNMTQLDRNSDLYKRYVTKFNTQEDQIEKLRDQVQKLQTQENSQRHDLDEYLANLEIS